MIAKPSPMSDIIRGHRASNPRQGFRQMGLNHGALDAELLADLFKGQPRHPVQQEHVPQIGRELEDRLG